MDELLKAALTLAGGKALEIGAEFLKRVSGPKADELGKEWAGRKTERVLTVASEASEIAFDLPLQQPPDRVFMPILNGAANEDDRELQSRWAALLAHAVIDPDSVPPAFPKILSELSPLEVKMLDFVMATGAETSGFHAFVLADVSGHFDINHSTTFVYRDNLERLNLLSREPAPLATNDVSGVPYKGPLYVTSLGYAFIRACTR